MKKYQLQNKGFTLIEMIVSIFIFSLIITTAIAAFASMTRARKQAAAVQQNMEDARYVLEQMAKTLRTSKILSPAANGTTTDLKAFDYSQNKCVEYKINIVNAKITYSDGGSDPASCSFNTFTNMNSGTLYGIFDVHPSIPGSAGKVTASLSICEACTGALDHTRVQTTVSLRDYQEVNP